MQPLSSFLYRSFHRSGDGRRLRKAEELEWMTDNRTVAMAPALGKNRVHTLQAAVGGWVGSCDVARVFGNSSMWMNEVPALTKNTRLPSIPRGPA